MDDQRLGQLLKEIDAGLKPPVGKDLIGGAIRRRARRRRNATIAAVGLIALAAGSAIRLSLPTHQVHVASNVQTPKTVVKEDEVALDIQLEVATRTLSGLLRAERAVVVDDHMQRVEEQRMILSQEREDAASSALVHAADLTDGAQAAVYRQIVQYFPGTGAALVAQRQLSVIQ